jgi:hypothetical protein
MSIRNIGRRVFVKRTNILSHPHTNWNLRRRRAFGYDCASSSGLVSAHASERTVGHRMRGRVIQPFSPGRHKRGDHATELTG